MTQGFRCVARVATTLALLGFGCGGASAPPQPPPVDRPGRTVAAAPTPDPDAFRRAAPEPGPEKPYIPPKIEEARLSNGIRLLFVERREMPIVALQVSVDRGADQSRPGLATLAASLLASGTATRSALQISDGFLALGAHYAARANHDGTFASLKVLVSEFEPALELFSDVLRNARFPAEEVRRELPRRQNAILAERDNPSVVLTNAVLDALYGSKHAYGVSLLGTQTSMKQVRPDELRAFHRTQVRPDRVTVAASGDISKAALLEALEKVFGSWQGRGVTSKPLPDPPAAAGGARILLVDRPGATQSHVAVADIGVARKTPDYEPLVVLNTILGGQFSSRLNLNLREAHAYTYGAGSVFDMRRFAGPFRTFGAIVKESTGPAIGEIFREIARLRSEPVTPQELSAAQTYLVRRLPARFETTSSTADALSTLAIYELPLDEYATYPARIARVTAADVQRVANAYLHPERMRIVVLGDAAALRPGLEALGLGAVEPRAMP